MTRETRFLALVDEALRVAHSAVWLDEIIDRHFLVAFDGAPGLFLVARKPATPRELAVQIAIRQVEAEAHGTFVLGYEQATLARRLRSEPPQGVLQ